MKTIEEEFPPPFLLENQDLLRIQYLRLRARAVEMEKSHSELKRRESILVDAMAEVKATNDGESTQPISDIVNGCIFELKTLPPAP